MPVSFSLAPDFAPANEPVRAYAPGSPERASLKAALAVMDGERSELPLFIGGEEVRTGRLARAICPHRHAHVLAEVHQGGAAEARRAAAAARAVFPDWSRAPWESRARVFLKAAELASGPRRDRLNAATMLGQSKTVHQAEIDAAAELADFWRFNVAFMLRLYGEQPLSPAGVRNIVDYRPLEGFVYAVTPFNFTAIAGNLPSAPALMGDVVVWKPSATAMLSASVVMDLLREAGLPDGVINLVYGDAAEITSAVLAEPDFAGLHFTGSTAVFEALGREIASRRYRNFPRVVGETGGKNFALVHPSADLAAVAAALIRGAFEYQGQKCSATARLFAPRSLWSALKDRLLAEIATLRVGDVQDFRTFMGAVIDEKAWRRLDGAVAAARASVHERILTDGVPDGSVGFFVPPTLVETDDVASRFMTEEFFGPILSAFVYDDADYDRLIARIDETSAYGLTGSVFARDRAAIDAALDGLRWAAGNIYVNDKSTGAVVGQQPFGGARASGTNDKAGSLWNLARWVSPRTIKETFAPPTDWAYPSMREA